MHVELFSSRKVIVYIYLHSEEVELSRGLEKLITCVRSDFFSSLLNIKLREQCLTLDYGPNAVSVLTKGVLFCWRIVLNFSRRC